MVHLRIEDLLWDHLQLNGTNAIQHTSNKSTGQGKIKD